MNYLLNLVLNCLRGIWVSFAYLAYEENFFIEVAKILNSNFVLSY
jgi:hypothetical protein